jgi:hypothetical protein
VPVTLPFICPACGARSYHPADAEHRYCVRCHRFVDDPTLDQALHALDDLAKASADLRAEMARVRGEATPPPRDR